MYAERCPRLGRSPYHADVTRYQPFADLPDGARRDLLRVLTSDAQVRADVIRQFHERGDEGMVEVLTELEANDLLRFQVIDELRGAIR
jgi:hypothetical protein